MDEIEDATQDPLSSKILTAHYIGAWKEGYNSPIRFIFYSIHASK